MPSKLLDKLGNWNPQLYREIKGRLTLRKVAIATFLSLIIQGLIMLFAWGQLPILGATGLDYNRYCTEYKYIPQKAGEACQGINWQLWWQDIFHFISWVFLIILVLGGIYMLVADIAKEKRLGTLNFINLSPQSSQKILLGKLLGVPILIYLIIALAIPLQLWAAYQANLSVDVLIWYGLLIAISSLFSTASLVFAFLGGNQAWLATIIGAFLLWPIGGAIIFITSGGKERLMGIEKLRWFFFPELQDAILIAWSLLLIRCLLRSYFFWQIANGFFRHPSGTFLTKKQSYFWTVEFQIFFLGFCWSLMFVTEKYNFQNAVAWVCIFNLIWFLLLISFLSPHRQALQDWAGYQHQQKSKTNSLISDLIWGEKSPALLAIAINLVITAAIWLPWILLSRQQARAKEEYVISLIMTISIILIYATFAQIALLKKTKNRALWAAIILACLLFLLPLAFLLVAPNPQTSPFLWLFSPIPFIALESASGTTIFIAFLSHLSILGLLCLQLTKKLKKAGSS
jgi:hypothetical protein